MGDLAATGVIFGFSMAHRNASFYDAYWSVAPPLLALPLWWLGDGDALRIVAVMTVVCLWSVRLTANWARGWTGLGHEDWRYGMLREQTGVFYPFVNLSGIHVFPTVQVFLGCLPLIPALTNDAPFGLFDVMALVLGLSAVLINHVADEQLRAFRAEPPAPVLRTGVWAWSRHPNYLGEMGMWWSLVVFGIAAGGAWWCLVGAASITAMFWFISIPMIEKRMVERRPSYADVLRDIPMVLPKPPVKR